MNELPLISVVTVAYNAEAVIERTVLSVLHQTFRKIEYLIIDGGSTDSTLEIANYYKKDFYKRDVKFIVISEKDNGCYDGMNKGVLYAKGEWIIFMNSGDSFYSDLVIERVFSNSIDNSIGIIYGDTNMIYNWGNMVKKAKSISAKNVMPFIHQSCFVRRKILSSHPFCLQYKIIADYNFFYESFYRKENALRLPILIANYDASKGLSADNPFKAKLEEAAIHGYIKEKKWFLRYLYYLIRFRSIMSIKYLLPKWLVGKIEKRRREKNF